MTFCVLDDNRNWLSISNLFSNNIKVEKRFSARLIQNIENQKLLYHASGRNLVWESSSCKRSTKWTYP